MAPDALILKHQAISTHSTDQIRITFDHFAWITNCTDISPCDVITHPCPDIIKNMSVKEATGEDIETQGAMWIWRLLSPGQFRVNRQHDITLRNVCQKGTVWTESAAILNLYVRVPKLFVPTEYDIAWLFNAHYDRVTRHDCLCVH